MIQLDVYNDKTKEFVPYSNFQSLSFSRSMENLSGTFSFIATKADDGEFPIKRRSPARVLVNGFPLITGFIDAMTPSISDTENVINVQGRDKTADFVDSTLNAGSVELLEGVTLKEIIEKTISALGQSLKVIDEVGNLEPFGIEDLVSSEAGQKAFEFVEAFARKRQVLLTTNGQGNIVITKSSTVVINYKLINRKDGKGNNIKNASISYDDSKRFNKYVVVSQGNGVALNLGGNPDLDQMVDSEGAEAIDSDIRPGRVLYLIAEKSSSPEQNALRAKWEANWRKTQSEKYQATTDDFTIPGTNEPFPINRLIPVVDEDNGINAIMLIESVGLSYSVTGGTETNFGIVNRNSYTIKLEEPIVEKSANDTGLGLT